MPLRILLVDDNVRFRGYLKTYLESRADCTVCGEASDGAEAIKQSQNLSPDLIVMDLSMPKMNGLEASRALKNREPHVPVVLFTLHTGAMANCDAAQEGVCAIISKSEPELLLRHVHQILKSEVANQS